MLKSNKVEVEIACTASVSSGRGANSFFCRARIGRAQKKKKKIAPIFARPKHRNLRGNPTETLATQAKVEAEEDGQNRRRLGLFFVENFSA